MRLAHYSRRSDTEPLSGKEGTVAGRPGEGGWPRTATGPPNTHGMTSTRHRSLHSRTPDHQ